jgi:hypothetical protein
MDFTILATQNGEIFDINVTIMDGETEILTGKTSVCCATEDEAKIYTETVFLPDLKANFKVLNDLELPEVVADDPSIDIEG